MHQKCTNISPNMHQKCTKNATKVHQKCTKSAPKKVTKSAPNTCQQRVYPNVNTSAPNTHRRWNNLLDFYCSSKWTFSVSAQHSLMDIWSIGWLHNFPLSHMCANLCWSDIKPPKTTVLSTFYLCLFPMFPRWWMLLPLFVRMHAKLTSCQAISRAMKKNRDDLKVQKVETVPTYIAQWHSHQSYIHAWYMWTSSYSKQTLPISLALSVVIYLCLAWQKPQDILWQNPQDILYNVAYCHNPQHIPLHCFWVWASPSSLFLGLCMIELGL